MLPNLLGDAVTNSLPLQRRPAPSGRGRSLRINRRAFTLIEVLVVVGIVALLAAVLIPALSRARTRAQGLACAHNLREIGLALWYFAEDHRGEVPRGGAKPSPLIPDDVATNRLWCAEAQTRCGLGILLGHYAPNPQIFFCPTDSRGNPRDEASKIGSDNDAYSSYLYRNCDGLDKGKRPLLGDCEQIVMDLNSYGPGVFRHFNHGGTRVNVLGHVMETQTYICECDNTSRDLSLREEDFIEYPSRIPARMDAIFTAIRSGRAPIIRSY